MTVVTVAGFPYKLGAVRSRLDDRAPVVERYVTLAEVQQPKTLDLTTGVKSWPMYGNDSKGDCTFAGMAHWYGIDSYEQSGTEYVWTDNQIVNDYLKFNHGQDVGAQLIDVCNHAHRKGLAGHKCLYAFAKLRSLDHDSVETAMYIFTGLYAGFEVPAFAMDQFQEGKPWDVSKTNNSIEGGHCVNLVGYNEVGPMCITWGRVQQMTWAFFDKYFFEAWCLIPTHVNEQPLLNKINLPALLDDAKRYAGEINPNSGIFGRLQDWVAQLFS